MLLEAEKDIYGIQFDVVYNANEVTFSEDQISHMFSSSDARANVSVYSKIKEPGLARVIMFDLGGNALIEAGNSEKVIELTYDIVGNFNGTFKIDIEGIVAAGQHGTQVSTVESFSFHGDTTDNVDSFSNIPNKTEIKGNFPNPFNPTTQIEFALSNENIGLVNVSVYDIQGRKVATLHNDVTSAGHHNYTFDANNLASGQYFVRITAPNFTQTKTMTLLK